MQYHKVIPIVIDNNPGNLEKAKKCGIYYSFTADDDLVSNVMDAIFSGNFDFFTVVALAAFAGKAFSATSCGFKVNSCAI